MMTKTLVVVESPAKAKTIEKFLGANYAVMASMGHLRDLPKSQFGIDVENHFEPKYINIRGKGDLIRKLKSAAKSHDRVFLASDLDREGEAIAWHLAHILGVPETETCRIEFNEITKNAIKEAVKHPRAIHLSRVDAQQTRRLLDRIVGYKLSPLLWKKVRKGLSAGRVQSVAVRLICDREREIQAFVEKEYWSITARLREPGRKAMFEAELVTIDGKKAVIPNEEAAERIKSEAETAEFAVRDVKKRERRRNPAPPFITSSLQQDAARKLGFTSKRTMMVAQQLYEGLTLGKSGPVGLITYMRTDSMRVAETAQMEAREQIRQLYGEDYLPAKAPVYTTKNAQDAHEAIRPTSTELTPKSIEKHLSSEQLKLYSLIWDRFLASQMKPAVYDATTIEIGAGRYGFRATGSVLKFAGFTAVYTEGKDEKEADSDKLVTLPDLQVNQVLPLNRLQGKQHFTEPPPRYTEATLVKTMEEKGIGRPSTYAPTIETILARGYVVRSEKRFRPTELGFLVIDLLKEHFPSIVDAAFTANLEQGLDEIAEGRQSREGVLGAFYDDFAVTLQRAEEAIGKVELIPEVSDELCEHCGRNMVVKTGRFGKFLACPGFPECRSTKPILVDIGVPCPKCGNPLVERRTRGGKNFYGCQTYPECDFVTWDRPLTEKCQSCGSFLVRHQFKTGRARNFCSNPACGESQPKKEPGAKEAAASKAKDSNESGADSKKASKKGTGKRRKSSE